MTSFVVAAGCVAEPDFDEVAQALPGAGGVIDLDPASATGEHEQGKYILGGHPDLEYFDGVMHFRVEPKAVDAAHKDAVVAVTASALGANLTATAADGTVKTDPSWLVGMILPGVGGGQLKIHAVEVRGSSTKFFLKHRRNTLLPFNNDYCGDASAGAYPVKGAYDASRLHHNTNALTFVCEDGVGAKCIDWGYIPGNTGPSLQPITSPNDWDYHQACSAMANADYCRIGEPHTREETPILIRDYKAGAQPHPEGTVTFPFTKALQHPRPFPGDPDTYYVEAAWRPGALTPICLSKVRWTSLPLDPCETGQSDHGLKDPRVNPAAPTCDELSFDELRDAGALIVNASKMMDAPMHRWRNPDPQKLDVVTTMRGFYIPSAPVTGPGLPPADLQRSTLPFGPGSGYQQYLGPQSMILRNLTGTLNEANMLKLYAWQTGNDRVIAGEAAAQALGLLVKLDFEGYAFTDPAQIGAPLQELRVCKSGSDHDTMLTTSGACTLSGLALPAP
jgi:hypothetical protein